METVCRRYTAGFFILGSKASADSRKNCFVFRGMSYSSFFGNATSLEAQAGLNPELSAAEFKEANTHINRILTQPVGLAGVIIPLPTVNFPSPAFNVVRLKTQSTCSRRPSSFGGEHQNQERSMQTLHIPPRLKTMMRS